MRSGLLVLGLVFFFGCKKNDTNQKSEIFNFEDHYSISYKISESNLLLIKVDLKDGLHAYGPGEKIGKPVSLVVKPDGGWKAVGAVKLPEAKLKTLSGLGASTTLEKHFELTQELKRGEAPGKALFFLQVCTANICDKPRTHEIILE